MLGRREALLSSVQVGQGSLVSSVRLGNLSVLAKIGGRVGCYRRLYVLEGLGFLPLFDFSLGFLLGLNLAYNISDIFMLLLGRFWQRNMLLLRLKLLNMLLLRLKLLNMLLLRLKLLNMLLLRLKLLNMLLLRLKLRQEPLLILMFKGQVLH